MPFVEEEKSVIEQYIGRRLPLATLLILATCYAAYTNHDALMSILGTIDAIVITGYFKDVGTENNTVKMIREAETLASNDND